MRPITIAIMVVAFACIACSAGRANTVETGGASGTPIAPFRSNDAATTAGPPGTLNWPPPPDVSAAWEGCPPTEVDNLDGVIALAVDGLDDTTSQDGWSTACARVLVLGGPEEPRVLSIKIGWMGTLHEFARLRGAIPIVGLADEAYALDSGHQIALRSGELVAVVRVLGRDRIGH